LPNASWIMSKPRLLYVTHVDWGHIWQRPHHIATGLTGYFDVTVAAPTSRRRRLLVANPDDGLDRMSLLRVPGSIRFAPIFTLNNPLCAAQLRVRVRSRVDCVMVTAPECFPWVAPWGGHSTLAYDCMDDAQAFPGDGEVRRAKSSLERALLARADVVFASSALLRALCIARGASEEKTIEVPNGWDARAFPVQPSRSLPASGPMTIAYFGTVDTWLDLAALEAAVRDSPELTIRLIGPNECRYVPSHPRIVLSSPVQHAKLAAAVADADAFVLPFQLTDLTRGVDPVKLYEYIALGRPVLSAYWPGLERFREFVTFYDGAEHFARTLAKRLVPAPPSTEQRAEFLAHHAWTARVSAIANALSSRARVIRD
jgi:glycosyltransferase involved in cell wall biosynthesis